ncbi:hypothetical protein HPB51_023025 [Rhipicephalus microplus]|uniref:DNA transposase THAP9 n=1 Tax=Rhipicephalus microplus TaxID=6941 RepID=A0A9J6D7B1_RHIMP|nr:hypothetical protein HPB51_023025 [Rhipicephalus microplus]
MMDDMAIKKHVQLVGKKVVGYIDLGKGISDHSLPEATNVCVFMLVGMNMRLKIPLGYFFIESLSGSERAALTQECLSRLSSIDVEVASLTFDGAASNFTMARCLGADLKYSSPKFDTSFNSSTEQTDSPNKVSVILDACHMLMLIRNCLGSVDHRVDLNGSEVRWSFIKELEKLQRDEGLHLENRLTRAHIEWAKQKMKVRLAVQTLSSSVADALDFCESTLKLPQFKGAHATAEFIRIFDRLFDVLNSRNPFGRSYKAALRKANEASMRTFFEKAELSITKLKDAKEKPVIESLKKTGFVGLLICMRSVTALFDRLVATGKLQYLLTHKMSQDHLETFFGGVRGKGGYNNNPTACQFTAAYKRLLIRTEVASSEAGNCSRDIVTFLCPSSDVSLVESPTSLASLRRSSLLQPPDDDNDCTQRVDFPTSLSPVVGAVEPYIAGFVARKVYGGTSCDECCSALLSSELPPLTAVKTNGGLVAPSKDVLKICHTVEKGLRALQVQYKRKKKTVVEEREQENPNDQSSRFACKYTLRPALHTVTNARKTKNDDARDRTAIHEASEACGLNTQCDHIICGGSKDFPIRSLRTVTVQRGLGDSPYDHKPGR